jgi:hypothetical protein
VAEFYNHAQQKGEQRNRLLSNPILQFSTAAEAEDMYYGGWYLVV